MLDAHDRRRVRFVEKCTCDSDESTARGQITDLSLGGAYVTTPHPFPVGHKFWLRFPMYGKWIGTTSVVRHVNPGAGMGVQFLSLPRDQRDLLLRYIGRAVERLGDSAHAKKRTASRLAACIPITVRGRDADGKPFAETTETVNVSERGACIRLRHPVLPGTVLKVHATLGSHAGPADFRVAWIGNNGTNSGQVGLAPTVLDLWRSWYVPNLQELESENTQSEFQFQPENRV